MLNKTNSGKLLNVAGVLTHYAEIIYQTNHIIHIYKAEPMDQVQKLYNRME